MAKVKEIDEILEVKKYKFPNNAVANYNGVEILLRNGTVGEKVKCTYKKTRRGYQGKVVEVIQKSPIAVEPKCKDFGLCGGCTFQNMTYENELKIKENMVLDLFEEAEIDIENYEGINQSPILEGYRNKMEYSFGDNGLDTPLSMGMKKRDSYYESVTADYCNIVDDDYNKITKESVDYFRTTGETFYHRNLKTGALRHLLVRKGMHTGQILIGVVTTTALQIDLNEYVNVIKNLKLDGEITGIVHIVNDAISDIVKADNINVLYGVDYIYDKLFDLDFKISIFSFFQTNTLGAEALYTIAKNYVGEQNNNTVFDLYCGAGTITQVMAEVSKKVIGVEIVEEAVVSARESAKQNGITNVEFIASDVLTALDEIEVKPDYIILDPPRDGINPKALAKIIDYGVDNLIYISCKPTSLVRDLKVFKENGYKISKVKLQDMFPRTYHVECVVLITKIDK